MTPHIYFGNELEDLGLQADIFFVRNLQNSANELQKFPFETYRITYKTSQFTHSMVIFLSSSAQGNNYELLDEMMDFGFPQFTEATILISWRSEGIRYKKNEMCKGLFVRYMGTITGISDLDTVRWPNSHWRSVKVGWDESTAGERQPRVSLWEIEPLTDNNFPHVSVIVSPQTETPMASWGIIFAWLVAITGFWLLSVIFPFHGGAFGSQRSPAKWFSLFGL
uniref:Auxin response factor domain-containing protein n=1 Tax=Quercus lobata TaxID=97700 RepID=A0A7N2MN81_QUELO